MTNSLPERSSRSQVNPKNLKYSKDHEWVRMEDGVAVIGITDYAQDQLGDVVYLDLPPVGTSLDQYAKFGEIESVKSVSELFSPISGEVIERNEAILENPELVNGSPYDDGWMLKVRPSDLSELDRLMSAEQYEEMTKAE